MFQSRIAFTDCVDLASEKLGGKALLANDEFFAAKENLLKPEKAVFIPGKYTDHGKWMDGWETRRKRTAGYDWCIIQLGQPGMIYGFNVDTDYFIGNFPEYCSVEACSLDGNPSNETLTSSKTEWKEILPKSALQGGIQNFFPVLDTHRWTHIRLNIFPDGGVARLRVHGRVIPRWKMTGEITPGIDLAAAENGAKVVTCNDNFFGPKDNLILPGRALTMGDGWETRRKRVPGYDWTVIQLATQGSVRKIEVDTNHFKGNYPESCSLEGCFLEGWEPLPVDFTHPSSRVTWTEILPRTLLQGHHRHFFEKEIQNAGPFSHIRLNIFPDGGISRLRVFGDSLGTG
jgi:allantoicase